MNDKTPARHYEKLDKGLVKCLLCSHGCVIADGKTGFCKSRTNCGGELFTLNYGRAVAVNTDPVEKKPLYHFYPGSSILSLGTNYCNLSCKFCQNYEISQNKTHSTEVTPQYIIRLAGETRNCCGVAFTYNEPTIWYEFVYDCARLIRKAGLKTVLVTNGNISGQAFAELAPFIDAMNIDLKAYSESFYRDVCGCGAFKTVLETIKSAYGLGVHVEVTNLLIPTLNDSERMISDLTDFMAGVSADIPLHFSRYHPDYLMDLPVTPIKTLNMAYETALKKLKFVYLGNVSDVHKNSTYCPTCGALLIERNYFESRRFELSDKGECLKCGEKIYGNF